MDRDRAIVATFAKSVTVAVEATVLAGGAGVVRIGPSASCRAPCRLTTTVPLGRATTPGAPGTAASTCNPWTSTSPDLFSPAGTIPSLAPGAFFGFAAGAPCSLDRKVYCLQE